MTEPNLSSYEERILAAALRLAQAEDDIEESSRALGEIVLCARGMLRRAPPEPGDLETRRRAITMVEGLRADSAESHVEYDDPKDGER